MPSNLPDWPGIMSNRDLACARWTTGFTVDGAQDVSRRRAGQKGRMVDTKTGFSEQIYSYAKNIVFIQFTTYDLPGFLDYWIIIELER